MRRCAAVVPSLRRRGGRRRPPKRPHLILLLWMVCLGAAVRAQPAPPAIVVQPAGGAAAVGETFALSVDAAGSTPLVYQWYVGGAAADAATNATLLLTNLTTGAGGNYFVVVTNPVGSVTSAVATLFVVTSAPRAVRVLQVTSPDGQIAEAPVVLNANGRETALQFSLQFDTNTFQFLDYTGSTGLANTVISSNASRGEVGVTVAQPFPALFPAGEQTVGTVRFALLGTNATALDGRLDFVNAPVPVQATDTNGLGMLLSAAVVPGVSVNPARPELNLQTGLFEQTVTVANPSGTTFFDLPVYVPWLGLDTAGNAMTLYDPAGTTSVDLDGDGSTEPVAFFLVPELTNGAVVVVSNGFYVTDHATSPVVDYYVANGGTPGIPMPAASAPLQITRATVEGADVVLEWSTRPDRRYSVNHWAHPAGAAGPDAVSTSTNTVTGTGRSVQWRDPAPADTRRFYQVVESP